MPPEFMGTGICPRCEGNGSTFREAPCSSCGGLGIKPSVGDRIAFTPRGGELWPWTVRARNDRFIVATTQCPFKPKGTLLYTVVDLTGWHNKRYNGEGNGVVRSSLDLLGGGWGRGVYDDAECREILDAVASGERDLSHRRVLTVRGIDVVALSEQQPAGGGAA